MVLENGKTFQEQFGPRGVMHSWAQDDGTQKIEDTGPLTKKRMETVDDETVAAAKHFITANTEAGQALGSVWWNGTRMHFRTHVREGITPASPGPSGNEYHDGMVEHDMHVGELLDLLDELGIAENTIVYVLHRQRPSLQHLAGCGLHAFPQGKELQLGGRLPLSALIRWPGRFPENVTLNGIVAHEDWLPTFAAIAGAPDIKEQLAEGVELNGRKYRNYIDGYDQLAYLQGEAEESPRSEFWYVNDDGQIVAARYDDWKVVFLENRGRLSASGASLLRSCACPSSSICAAIPSNEPSTTPILTMTGCSTGPLCWCRSRAWRPSSWLP